MTSSLENIAYLYSSASDLQAVSNTSHLMWGVSLLAVVCLLFLYSFGYKKKFLSLAVSIILLLTVIIFFLYLLLNRGLNNFWNTAQIIFSFPEFYVHIAMSLIASFGVIVELLVASGKIKHPLAPLALPLLSSIGVGFLFIIHPRSGLHDANTMFVHSLMGSAFIFTGIMIAIQRLIKNSSYERIFGIFASISLASAAFLLIQFKESTLAYQSYFPVNVPTQTTLEANNNAIVYIADKGVVPQNIRIKKGGQITFYQADTSWHDMASGPHPIHTEYPPLNIGFLKQGESRTVTFTEVGNFGFHDHIHENDIGLQGKIEVYE